MEMEEGNGTVKRSGEEDQMEEKNGPRRSSSNDISKKRKIYSSILIFVLSTAAFLIFDVDITVRYYFLLNYLHFTI